MNKAAIEEHSRRMLSAIWRDRQSLWPLGVPQPLDMLEPAVAAQVLGVSFVDNVALSNFGFRDNKFEIGGLIDRQSRRIAVSGRFPYLTRRFTGAHEIGHWVMHSGLQMHRDLPIDGVTTSRAPRNPEEREADYFAACFLMPSNLVRSVFESKFGQSPFTFDDNSAFYLNPSNPRTLLSADQLERAYVLAKAESYAGNHFYSMSQEFRVSQTSMAIRLLELQLIRHP